MKLFLSIPRCELFQVVVSLFLFFRMSDEYAAAIQPLNLEANAFTGRNFVIIERLSKSIGHNAGLKPQGQVRSLFLDPEVGQEHAQDESRMPARSIPVPAWLEGKRASCVASHIAFELAQKELDDRKMSIRDSNLDPMRHAPAFAPISADRYMTFSIKESRDIGLFRCRQVDARNHPLPYGYAPAPEPADDGGMRQSESFRDLPRRLSEGVHSPDDAPFMSGKTLRYDGIPDCNASSSQPGKNIAATDMKTAGKRHSRKPLPVEPNGVLPFIEGQASVASGGMGNYDTSSHAALPYRGWSWSGTGVRSSGFRSRFIIGRAWKNSTESAL